LGSLYLTAISIFFLQYALRKVQENQEGLEVNDLNQVLVLASDTHMWKYKHHKNLHTVMCKLACLPVMKEINLEVTAYETQSVSSQLN
jgi:hypothetical protein